MTAPFETIDARGWWKRNLWRTAAGDLAVRPGLRRIYPPESGRELAGGFSIDNVYTGETWHYVFDVAATGSLDLTLRVLTEDFETWQILNLNVDMVPRAITHGVVEGQILIGSPDMPTLWGLIGGAVRIAESVASDNPATTAIAVPRGIVATFNNRFVIANGPSLFFGDPIAATGGDGRTFVGENQNQRPGTVYGLHEGAGGMLVVVTDRGTYGLPAAAGAVGIVGSNGTDWYLLSHHSAFSFASSCAIRGRVYALSAEGFVPVDQESEQEQRLTDGYQSRAFGPRISLEDYRECRMYGDDDGPVISADIVNAVHMTSLSNETVSWWTSGYDRDDFRVRGLLHEPGGSTVLLCANGVFRMEGNFDGDIALESDSEVQPVGVLFGVVPSSPMENKLARCVSVAAEAYGQTHAAVRGKAVNIAGRVDDEGITIGIDSWGTATKRYTATPFSVITAQFGGIATRELGIEVAADRALTRIHPLVDLEVTGSATTRKGYQGGS